MLFVGFGLLIGQDGLGICDLSVDSMVLNVVAEITLILVLFTDATRIPLRSLRQNFSLPLRMLIVGLPLTMVLGTIIGIWIFPGLTFFQVAVLAAVLAPTDAALGQVVVSSRRVPVRIRQTLNVESGLNDGIALPVVMILAVLGEMGTSHSHGESWVTFTVLQLTLGPLVGIGVGYAGGWLLQFARERGSMSASFEQLSALALAFSAFGLAHAVGGNGFIAAFMAGLTLGNLRGDYCEAVHEFAESEGQLLTLIAFLLFGTTLVGPAFRDASFETYLYAILSLTLIRMLPVTLSLLGTGLKPASHLFLGWFGPRGLASLLFGLIVLEHSSQTAGAQVLGTVVVTVTLSILLHGLSASPAVSIYSAWVLRREQSCELCEKEEIPELPARVSSERE